MTSDELFWAGKDIPDEVKNEIFGGSFITTNLLKNKEKQSNTKINLQDSIFEIYDLVDKFNINFYEKDILNFLQIENRWPYKYIQDIELGKQNIPAIHGYDTPIQVITQENFVERDKFYNRNGKFIFDEWKKYYDLGFTTMISDVLDLTPDLRVLRNELFKITGMQLSANFYLTKGSSNKKVSWLPHRHHYSVVVKVLYGKTKWRIGDKFIEYCENQTLLIPAETEHTVVECESDRLTLTINLF